MSMYKCRHCGEQGHLNDQLIGHYYDKAICIRCIKKMTPGEKEIAWQQISEMVAEAHAARNKRPPSSNGSSDRLISGRLMGSIPSGATETKKESV